MRCPTLFTSSGDHEIGGKNPFDPEHRDPLRRAMAAKRNGVDSAREMTLGSVGTDPLMTSTTYGVECPCVYIRFQASPRQDYSAPPGPKGPPVSHLISGIDDSPVVPANYDGGLRSAASASADGLGGGERRRQSRMPDAVGPDFRNSTHHARSVSRGTIRGSCVSGSC